MAFTIEAELPLGTYRGAGADGRAEPVPSVARLYSALLCAAGFGPRAMPQAGDLLGPCEADEIALRWLEENPPDAVTIPSLEVNRGRATAYREDGTIKVAKKAIGFKKLAKTPDASVAMAGPVCWTWVQDPPPQVVAAIEALCPDVSHLGTAESPVRLRALVAGDPDAVAVTHRLDPDAGLFAGAGGYDVEVPVSGRLPELKAAHEANRTVPALAKDRYRADEDSQSPVPPRQAVALARYSPVVPTVAEVPWPQVLLVPLAPGGDRPAQAMGTSIVPERERLRLAVSVHRALVRAIGVLGVDVPPLVTGAYPPGAASPANRLAIHVVDARMPVDLEGASAAIALLLPRDAQPVDLDLVVAAVRSLKVVYGAGGRTYAAGPARVVSGSGFWRAKAPGTIRLWHVVPAAVPDSRGAGEGPWTFAHAAMLSLGHVWRDFLPAVPGRGDERRRAVVDVVNDRGAAVLRATPLRDSDVRPYVHKVNPHAVVRPYRADLWLGDLCPENTVQAIGQTRHLGGGLLVPVDRPVDEAVRITPEGGAR